MHDSELSIPIYLRTICERLGIPGFADVHVHFMPDNVQSKVWEYLNRSGTWPIEYGLPLGERLDLLESFSVIRYSGLSYPHRPGMAQWLNAWSTELSRSGAGERGLVHSATFYPEVGAADYVVRAVEDGARIFKSHLQVGKYDPVDPLLDGVWATLEASGIPVVVHCGNGPEEGPFCGIAPFTEVLERFPSLTAVIAHMGLPDYGEFITLAERFENVHLDTTMVFTPFTELSAPFPMEELPRLEALRSRVVLGTDFPSIPYGYDEQIRALDSLGLGDGWLSSVLWENGARLLGTS